MPKIIKDLRQPPYYDFTEDELKKGEEDIQKLTDKYVKLTEEKYEKKCKEIMTI